MWTRLINRYRNIIDETKDTHGTKVDRDVGESIDAGKGQGGISDRAKDLLNKAPGAIGHKAEEAGQAGFKVGEEADLHHLAQSKQP